MSREWSTLVPTLGTLAVVCLAAPGNGRAPTPGAKPPTTKPRPLRADELERISKSLRSRDERTRHQAVYQALQRARGLCENEDMEGLRAAGGSWARALGDVAADHRDRVAVRVKATEALGYLAPVSDAAYRWLDLELDPKTPVGSTVGKPSLVVLGLGAKAARLFTTALHDDNYKIRRQAARYLGELRMANREAATALLEACTDPVPEVRTYAAFALGDIAYARGETGVPAAKVVPVLVVLAKHSRRFGPVCAAQRALGDIGPAARAAIPVIKKRIGGLSMDIEAGYALARIDPNSPDGLDHLIKLVKKPDPMISFNACIALGRIGPPARRAIPAIEKHIVADNAFVKRVTAEVLAKITGKPKKPRARPASRAAGK